MMITSRTYIQLSRSHTLASDHRTPNEVSVRVDHSEILANNLINRKGPGREAERRGTAVHHNEVKVSVNWVRAQEDSVPIRILEACVELSGHDGWAVGILLREVHFTQDRLGRVTLLCHERADARQRGRD